MAVTAAFSEVDVSFRADGGAPNVIWEQPTFLVVSVIPNVNGELFTVPSSLLTNAVVPVLLVANVNGELFTVPSSLLTNAVVPALLVANVNGEVFTSPDLSFPNVNSDLFLGPESFIPNLNGEVLTDTPSLFPKANALPDDAFPCNPLNTVFDALLVLFWFNR